MKEDREVKGEGRKGGRKGAEDQEREEELLK